MREIKVLLAALGTHRAEATVPGVEGGQLKEREGNPQEADT